MKGISKEFMIGILVLGSVAVLVIGINFLKGINLFEKPQTYYAIYPNAGLLTESNPVLMSGVKVGLVKSVRLHPSGDSRVVVEVIINDRNLLVPLDSKMKIISADLFGTKAVMLEIGDSTVMAANKDTLQGLLEDDLVQSLKSEFEPLKDKTQKLIARVDEAVTNLNKVFGDTATMGLPRVFTSLQHTMENLEQTTMKVNQVLADNSGRLGLIFTNVESISANLKGNNETLTRAIQNIALMTDSLAKIQLAGTIRKVDKAMTDFAEITGKINNGDGTLGQLINNDSLHFELVNASHSLDLLLNDMRIHPNRYLNFSLVSRKDKAEFSKKELEQMRDEIDKAILDKSGVKE